ncbi:MAG: GGDEF domain-containing protein [Alphaproteobacteria bacterium]|nr:GGDEF domain-containing protein [Alphaproteobacteria bacterium]
MNLAAGALPEEYASAAFALQGHQGGTVPGVGIFSRRAVERLIGGLTATSLFGLLEPGGHSLLVKQRRAHLVLSRVRAIATVFAVFTPLWIILDLAFFPWPLWGWLALGRLAATAAFVWMALGSRNTDAVEPAIRALVFLQLIPTVFFLVAEFLLGIHPTEGFARFVAGGYQFLPFVMISTLSVFPITLLEGLLFSLPMVLAMLGSVLYGQPMVLFSSTPGALWLLLLLSVSATLAGMSQLHFMSALVTQSARDLLTHAYTRRVGEELLDMLFISVVRAKAHIAVAFFDLDNFKSINDRYGHEEGDRTLQRAAEALRAITRRNDVLIRWGGEELLIAMPFTDCAGARVVLQRLAGSNLGLRPDGKPQTASAGLSERLADDTMTWQFLVEKADRRMYVAKQSGKDRALLCGDEVLLFESRAETKTPA